MKLALFVALVGGFGLGVFAGWLEWGREVMRKRKLIADKMHAVGFQRGYNARERELKRGTKNT